jgi:oligopeptide/dipeptide ABC transporter ATP-binding protein
MALLDVKNLSVEYETQSAPVQAVNDVSFTVERGERMGLVGESGCGKTTIAKSLIGLLPKNGRVTGGSIELTRAGDGSVVDLTDIDQKTLRKVRWAEVAMISQSAMNALDPVYTVGRQIVEAIQFHEDVPKKAARERAGELIDRVGIDKEHLNSYPHQLSGGMRQRAMIAMALALDPPLILADEPTTALDVVTQDHILSQIDDLCVSENISMLMITHDISVVSETCDKIGIMYAGELVEAGPIRKVFKDPQHPYTQGLLNAFPSLDGEGTDLITITGQPPDLRHPPTGCSFYDRCPYSEERCLENRPTLTPRGEDRQAACFVTEDGYDIGTNYERILEESPKWQKL